MVKRQYILDNIKKVFQKFGFQPLEFFGLDDASERAVPKVDTGA